jgi:hypothetical protein
MDKIRIPWTDPGKTSFEEYEVVGNLFRPGGH